MPVAAAGDSVAVIHSGWPATDGLADEVSVTLAGAKGGVTISDTTAEVLVPFAASPVYAAVSGFEPTGKVAIDSCAWPFTRFADPTDTPLLENATEPVALAGVTVAVKVTVPP